jgi:hypothetical protein
MTRKTNLKTSTEHSSRRIPRLLCAYYLSIAGLCLCYANWQVALGVTGLLICLRMIRRKARAGRARDLDAPTKFAAQLENAIGDF